MVKFKMRWNFDVNFSMFKRFVFARQHCLTIFLNSNLNDSNLNSYSTRKNAIKHVSLLIYNVVQILNELD